jgi:hypothetical protein
MQGLYRGILLICGISISFLAKSQSAERWNIYSVSRTVNTSNLDSKKMLGSKKKGKSLENNIANFYLYKNGVLVKPSNNKIKTDFFPAACLCFKFNDTLMLNSGLGPAGVGVGIKIYKDKFSGLLHANSGNELVYKLNKGDDEYLKNILAEPESQSLKLVKQPSFSSGEVVVGEYRAVYKRFYQKNDSLDVAKKYSVRLIFKCKITGIDAIKDETSLNSR